MKRSVLVLIYNSLGQLALQLRAENDDAYPSHWDFSAGGGIGTEEDPESAAVREVKEELGVDLSLQFVRNFQYSGPDKSPDGPVLRSDLFLFKAKYNGQFVLDTNEVAEVKFFNLSDIEKMITNYEKKFHPELVFVFKNFRNLI